MICCNASRKETHNVWGLFVNNAPVFVDCPCQGLGFFVVPIHCSSATRSRGSYSIVQGSTAWSVVATVLYNCSLPLAFCCSCRRDFCASSVRGGHRCRRLCMRLSCSCATSGCVSLTLEAIIIGAKCRWHRLSNGNTVCHTISSNDAAPGQRCLLR